MRISMLNVGLFMTLSGISVAGTKFVPFLCNTLILLTVPRNMIFIHP